MKGFKYSEGMNYKVQSFATADIHMIALGLLWREAIKHRDKFLLVNTVHDSVLIDCRREYKDMCCNTVKNKLECVMDVLKDKFNIDFDLPLRVDLKVGESWGSTRDYD
jgi:DNA polymerase I-like protein with 3'-5' exonuclease and polymerase domains